MGLDMNAHSEIRDAADPGGGGRRRAPVGGECYALSAGIFIL
jgi:hypothetical protein